MKPYVYQRQMGFPQAAEPPRPGADSEPGTQRYPDGVEVCSSPEAYYHVLVRSKGELCVRLLGPDDGAAFDPGDGAAFVDDGTVLRHVRGTWRAYQPRPGRSPAVRTLTRTEVLDELRRCRPVLVGSHEVADLLGENHGPADTLAGPSARPARTASPAGGPR